MWAAELPMTEQKQGRSENNSTNRSSKDLNRKQAFDPLQLETIELTAYVLGLIRKEVTTEQLVQSLGRNYSLASAYLRMFDQLNWIENKEGKWVLTELGEVNLTRFQEQ